MNIAIGTRRNTWKGLKSRYLVGVGGILLAAGITYAGITTLPESDSDAAVAGAIANQPQPLFPTAADAVFAVESGVAVTPQFANMADAAAALPVPASNEIVLSESAPQFSAEARDAYLGLGQPGELSAIAAVEQPLTPELEVMSSGLPVWETTIADRPVGVVEQPLSPELEAMSAGYPPFP